MELLIDPEFKGWIMPLREDEYVGLKENIRQYGCTQPLDIWRGIIVDGHNRYKICKELGISFEVHEMDFSTREEAKNFMIRNQLARRNVTSEQRDYLMGKMYHEQKSDRIENINRDASSKGQNVQSSKSEQIGEQFRVNGKTVQRAEQFAIAVDSIATNCGKDIRDKILSGDVQITKSDVMRLATLPRNEQQAAVSNIRKGMKGKHAIDRVWEEDVPAEEDRSIRLNLDTIQIPCSNPRCNKEIRVTKTQYKECMGVFPEKYGHVSLLYCSNNCRNIHLSEMSKHAIKC